MGLFSKKNQETTILVDGIKCPMCVKRIVETLSKHNVETNICIETKEVKLSYNEKKISLENIKKIIDDLGYKCL